jgi:hypothetical protein
MVIKIKKKKERKRRRREKEEKDTRGGAVVEVGVCAVEKRVSRNAHQTRVTTRMEIPERTAYWDRVCYYIIC